MEGLTAKQPVCPTVVYLEGLLRPHCASDDDNVAMFTLVGSQRGRMGRRTKKVGICGKYGTRYGASLRKIIKKIEVSQHSKYTCVFCGKVSMRSIGRVVGEGEVGLHVRRLRLPCSRWALW